MFLQRDNISSNRDVISLFSGAMGLDIGLSQAGLLVKVGQDIDNSCVTTMRANNHQVLEGDIRKLQPQQLLEAANLSQGEPFLVCGGPPCQPFSTAGKRKGIADPCGSLFMDFIRMIDYMRPRFFIMENVKGLMSSAVSSKNSESKVNGSALDIVLKGDRCTYNFCLLEPPWATHHEKGLTLNRGETLALPGGPNGV
ncbi:MAG: DNA (cytosine-5-)-methyltransferase [Synergistaceae bacterium]|nr:DNA (cytosine-5-)-methyltransferase [Synergistaceae bacterium]